MSEKLTELPRDKEVSPVSDPARTFPPDLLPGQLGLNEAHVKKAAAIVKEALAESAGTIGGMIHLYAGMLIDTEQNLQTAVVSEIQELYELALSSVSLRALAAGIAEGKDSAPTALPPDNQE